MILQSHSYFSLLQGLSKPIEIAGTSVKRGYDFAALTDLGSLSGCVSFIKGCSEICECGEHQKKHLAGKGKCVKTNCQEFKQKKIKPILGCELYVCEGYSITKDPTNKKLSKVTVLAKNLQGWKELIKIVSFTNSKDRFYNHPRLNIKDLEGFNKGKDLIAFSGGVGSTIGDMMFQEPKLAYLSKSYESAKSLVKDDWEKSIMEHAQLHQDIFGKENFFFKLDLIDAKHLPASEILSKTLRHLGKKHNITCFAGSDSYYPTKDDAKDQRLLLATNFKTTLNNVEEKTKNSDDCILSRFLFSNNYHVPTRDELEAVYSQDELNNTKAISEMCEVYKIDSQPMIPNFVCPNNLDPIKYIRELCIKGWRDWGIPPEQQQKYGEQVKFELDVLDKAGLSSYFLIVQDYCDWARKNGMLVGAGRGSVGGSLIAALIGITARSIDPIKNGLYFDRFYNSGRITPGKISLPDIDCDFPVSGRDSVVEYIKNKYGKDRVSQIATYGRMQGRGALKDVLRAHGTCSFTEMDRITKCLPQEASIAGELQEMIEETGESSIIRWALENTPKLLQDWCVLKEDGTLEGDYAPLFAQAIRLEGTKKSRGKHAAGVVIAQIPIAELSPMVYDSKSQETIAAMEMADLEYMGAVKFDLLGLGALDKVMGVQTLLKKRKITHEIEKYKEEEEED